MTVFSCAKRTGSRYFKKLVNWKHLTCDLVQIIRDISKSVTAIQNAGLGEFRIRDLNDHINKLLREKKHWENRLRELGGKSYSSKGAKMLDR